MNKNFNFKMMSFDKRPLNQKDLQGLILVKKHQKHPKLLRKRLKMFKEMKVLIL